MSHKIGKNDTSLHIRERPWHGLGEFRQEEWNGTMLEFCEAAKCDWQVEERKIYARDEERKLYVINSHKQIVRGDTGEHIGVVKKSWTPLQNTEFAEYFQAFVDEGMTPETMGSLKDGKLMFCLLRFKDFEIAGDAIRTYLTGLNSHDGSTAVTISPTNVRVVCYNTFSAALRETQSGELKNALAFTAKHTSNMKDRMEEFKQTMIFMNNEQKRLKAEAERLLKVRMSSERYKGLVDELLPFPVGDEVTDRMKANVKEKRAQLWTAVKEEDLENIRKTGWGAYQAVSDYVTHRGRQNLRSRETRFLDLVQGHKMLVDTRKIVLAYN